MPIKDPGYYRLHSAQAGFVACPAGNPQNQQIAGPGEAHRMAGPTPHIRRMQFAVVALLMLGGIVNYLDRSALAVANVSIRQELGLNATAMGVLLSAFLLAYAAAQIPIGILIDKLGPRALLGAGIAFWSAVQMACGFIVNFRQFYFLRILLGWAPAKPPSPPPASGSSATGSGSTNAACPPASSTPQPSPAPPWPRRS
jgi:MFS family permease